MKSYIVNTTYLQCFYNVFAKDGHGLSSVMLLVTYECLLWLCPAPCSGVSCDTDIDCVWSELAAWFWLCPAPCSCVSCDTDIHCVWSELAAWAVMKPQQPAQTCMSSCVESS